MEKSEIIEGNKLIAEFKGYFTESDDPECDSSTYFCDDKPVNISDNEDCETAADDWARWLRLDEMRFHTSWDWLMPVVGKIKNVDAKFRCKHIGAFVSWEHRFKESLYIGIDNTYRDVVEFIKWYNENK